MTEYKQADLLDVEKNWINLLPLALAFKKTSDAI